jgi:hypothetical protein
MAISRKDALKQMNGVLRQVQLHLEKLAARPDDRDAHGWKKEVRGWLRQIQEYLPHVGKKTAAEWQARLDACWSELGE